MADGSSTASMNPGAFRALVNNFQQSRVLLTAYELGLFTALGEEAQSSGEVASALKTDPRATDRLMNALVAMGLLAKHDGRFTNDPFAARYLVRDKPGYMSGLMHSVHLWETWSTLTAALRAGHGVASREAGEDRRGWREAFIAAMHWRGAQQAPDVVRLIDLSRVTSLLDVGGGSGAFAMAFVRAKLEIHATVFDLPDIVPITRRYIEQEGLADRISIVSGDLTCDELGRGFDVVFLSAIVHSFTPEENRRLVQKAARALRPGGRVVVQDFVMSEDRSGPLSAALFALNMLVGTAGGDTFTESEIRGWMREAGLDAIERRDTSFGTTLMMGTLGRVTYPHDRQSPVG